MQKIDLLSFTYEELESYIIELGEKKFRAKQIFDWLHKKRVFDISDMRNLPEDFIAKLKETSYLPNVQIHTKLVSKEDGTVKYLFKLDDGNTVESVLMKYKFGTSACISSQVGCSMGCYFCASTMNGLVRNLTAGEMLKQIHKIEEDTGERISSLVIMGSGEPFQNYENLMKFIRNAISQDGLNLGQRHITVSTCGLVDKIRKFADEETQVNLAISLHASNDKVRRQIMPIAQKYSIKETIDACRYYIEKNNRRVNIEYALIKDINDSLEHAKELAQQLKGLLCFVNLIPINEVEEREYKKTSTNQVNKFATELEKHGVQTTIRRELGSDINAACGQLRNKTIE